MKKNNLKFKFILTIILFINFQTAINSEIMILKGCKNLKDGFLKNEYIFYSAFSFLFHLELVTGREHMTQMILFGSFTWDISWSHDRHTSA